MSYIHGTHLLAVAIVGVINFLPVMGLLSAERLESAYGIAIDSAELSILLRHRALLFGVIGGFVLVSLALPYYRLAALLLAAISMSGFLLIAWSSSAHATEITRVVRADLVGLGFLLLAVFTR